MAGAAEKNPRAHQGTDLKIGPAAKNSSPGCWDHGSGSQDPTGYEVGRECTLSDKSEFTETKNWRLTCGPSYEGLQRWPLMRPVEDDKRVLIPKAPLTDLRRGFPRGEISDSFGAGDSRHAISGEIARRLFGGRASHARSPIEGRQPEPSSSVAGCGSRWSGPGGGGEDRRRGSPDAARLGHRFNASGPEGLIDNRTEGPKPRLSEEQLAQFAKIVEAEPDREKDGIVRWRRVDLKRVIAERFGVDFHPRYVGKLLKKLDFSHISARPPNPALDERIVEGSKKASRAR